MQKLKQKELPEWKKQQMAEQGFVCPLCGDTLRGIPLSKVAADHCHETGNLRAVVHMSCNRAEGIILKTANNWFRKNTLQGRVKALRALADYWEYHRKNPSGLWYPTHKTEEQAKEAKLKKARLAARKRRLAGAKK